MIPPMRILSCQRLVLTLDFGNKCFVSLCRLLKFTLPFVCNTFLLREHLMMVKSSSTLLLTASLIRILLSKLYLLHFCSQLLNLLTEPCNFCLKGALHVIFEYLCLTLSLVCILRVFLYSLNLFSVLIIAIFKVLRSDSAVFK